MTLHEIAPPPGARLALGTVTIGLDGLGLSRRLNRAETGAGPRCDLIVPSRAPIRFCQGGLTGEVPVGSYVLLRRDGFYDLSAEVDLAHLQVSLPLAALRDRLAAAEDHVGGRFRPHPQMAALLARTLAATVEVFGTAPPPRPEAVGAELIALIALVLGSETGGRAALGRTGRRLTRQRIIDHIDAHLADPGLTPHRIAQSLQISRSYLYELFADSNATVAGFIHARRLQAAYEMLVADPAGALQVSEIAYRTGFKSLSHFSRSFSRHFRASPRAVRTAAQSTGAA